MKKAADTDICIYLEIHAHAHQIMCLQMHLVAFSCVLSAIVVAKLPQ